MYTENESGSHASEVCEPEGTDTHFTRAVHKAQTADECNCQQPKESKHTTHQLESTQPLI